MPATRAGRLTPRRIGLLAVVLGMYGAMLLAGPYLHHDLDCHFKSRTHCATCIFNAATSVVECALWTGARQLADAGQPQLTSPPTWAAPALWPTNDRSPPIA